MTPLLCLIVEDEFFAGKLIENYIMQSPNLRWVATCDDVESAQLVLKENEIDLIFVDINLPKISGLDFVKSISSHYHFIFTTAYHEHALEGFELNAIDYLLKPIQFERFTKAVEKAIDVIHYKLLKETNQPSQRFLYLKCNSVYEKIFFSDIQYIEALHNYISIVTAERKLLIYCSISKILEELPAEDFVRIHRSFIVATEKVIRFSPTEVTIGSKKLPISKGLKKMVLERLGHSN
ncbi:MAG TPA: LytTR family DNA-binding domain-containing protein [Chitinophagaceae bacterium]|nr:LytTR family DNA-binding domain-containing protein [Chitinophagaceae bacterium]